MNHLIFNFKDKGYEPDAVLNYVTSVGSGFTDSTAGKTLQELISLVCMDVHNISFLSIIFLPIHRVHIL